MYNLTPLCLNGTLSCDFMDVIMGDWVRRILSPVWPMHTFRLGVCVPYVPFQRLYGLYGLRVYHGSWLARPVSHSHRDTTAISPHSVM